MGNHHHLCFDKMEKDDASHSLKESLFYKRIIENSTTYDDDDTLSASSEVSIPRPIRFWLLLLMDIPAVTCTFFLLYHLFFNKNLRKSLHNHVIIVLLILALSSHLVDIPSYITFLHLGYVWISTPAFCTFWSFVSVGLFNMLAIRMAFGAVERYILIFHSGWMATKRKRLLLHYLPLSLIITYGISFYVFAIFFPPCENVFGYTQAWCGYSCYFDNTIINMHDTIGNCILPTLIIAISSAALFIRFIRQKRRVQQLIRWRHHRKMVIQLLAVSLLHVIFNFPLLILMTAHLCGLPEETGAEAELYTYFFTYFISLLLPYIYLACLPELWKHLNILPIRWLRARLQRTNTVIPTNVQQNQ